MIDTEYGKEKGTLKDEEIALIKEVAYAMLGTEQEVLDLLAREFDRATDVIEKILDGEIAPYVGGPLRPLQLQGCNPKYVESTRNRQQFVIGVIFEARMILTDNEYEVFCHFNGMKISEADGYLGNLGTSDGQADKSKLRSVLAEHARGKTVEQAVSDHKKQARASSRK